jgi:hypothetical protein
MTRAYERERERCTDHADIGILIDKRAKKVHFGVQVGPPDVAYPLACDALCAILTTYSTLLQLRTVSKAHARLVTVQSSASTSPTDTCGRSQASP